MIIPIIGGFPLHLWMGLLLLVLLSLQILTGKRIIKVPFIWHRTNALIIFLLALGHAFLAIGVWLGNFRIG